MTAGGWGEALSDISASLARTWLWTALGLNDIRQRYSGSVLGSFWITANTGLLVACLTLVLAGPLGATAERYAPYVAIGLVLWHFIQASLIEAASVFVTTAETIRHLPMPLSIQVFRLVWRNAIVLAHNVILIPIILILFRVAPGAGALMAIPAFLLLLLNLVATTLLLGLLGARFRDVPQIVANSMQLLFFATPIFWFSHLVGAGHGWVVAANPLFAFVDIVRAPLLGDAPAASSWPVALAVTAVTAATAFVAFARYRARVSYWV